MLQLEDSLSASSLRDDRDEPKWRWTKSEAYTVKSMYNFLMDGGVQNRHLKRFWKIKSPLKVKIFVWTILHRKVLTADNLAKRGWQGVESCVLCQEDSETLDHLFIGCAFTKSQLVGLSPNLGALASTPTVNRLWETGDHNDDVLKRQDLTAIAALW